MSFYVTQVLYLSHFLLINDELGKESESFFAVLSTVALFFEVIVTVLGKYLRANVVWATC